MTMAFGKFTDKSPLLTPDPYHTPGYSGYCPQFKFRMGKTFGKTTSNLLRDGNVASSGKLVLVDITKRAEEDIRQEVVKARNQSLGDQKLVAQMVPGYAGYIPKGQHCYGTRYTDGCQTAIADFELDQREHRTKMDRLRKVVALQIGLTPISSASLPPLHIHPLKPLSAEPKPYVSPNPYEPLSSPFYMDRSDPNKKFMAGYTGFVPRSRGRIGQNYPAITNGALIEFMDDSDKLQSVRNKPVTVKRHEKIAWPSNTLYPIDMGMVTNYTGHIPGQKFRFGETFGQSTANATNKSLTART